MKLDSHQHFWVYDEQQYPWIPKGSPLQRDWLPNDLAPLLAMTGLDGSIAVQARQTVEESRWLLTLADHAPMIKGVVGWVDLRSDKVEEQLVELSKHPKFVAVRHLVQDEPDDQFMVRREFLRGIGRLRQFNLTYDILIYPKQLPAAIELAKRFPEQPLVLDHIAKALIKDGTISPWREQIRELAQARNVFCKVSGMVTEADHAKWRPSDLKPYLDIVFEAFSEDRLMYGSDWPVCLLAGSYERVFALVEDYTRQLSGEARAKFFGGNAARFYGVQSERGSRQN
ncbi:MAG: amidohydrolase [Verrucomicrobia bacterium]|nr:MAG: amidohydrolase [Verrucomicrobiota bacterium]